MPISRPFHIQLYCGDEADPQPPADAAEPFEYEGLAIPRGRPVPEPGYFACSFEQWMETLHSWPNTYSEGDGSWSWVADELDDRRQPTWRLEGMVYDRGGRVFYVEAQGSCTPAAWWQFIAALPVPPDKRLAICLAKFGVWVEQDDFGEWIQS